MATAFRDCVLDRINSLSKRIATLTSKENPHRSPSTADMVVDELCPVLEELEVLHVCLKRISKDPR